MTDLGEYTNVPMKQVTIDAKHTWLTEGLHAEFDTFIPMGTKVAKAAEGTAANVVFKTYSRGIVTCRDAWAYNFSENTLTENIQRMIETYNTETDRWKRQESKGAAVDNFVISDDTKISWSEALKRNLQRGKTTDFSQEKIRTSLYRPFTKSNLYFDRMMTERVYVFPSIFPTPASESENRVICVNVLGVKNLFTP